MLYLLRHGLDDETYLGGWSDVDLIEEGIKQVEVSTLKMKELNLKIDKIIASDVKRAKTTAEIVSDILGIPSFEVCSLFKEQNKGLLNGMLREKAENLYPELKESNISIATRYPSGESLCDLYKRMKDNLEYINSLSDQTLIITHRGVINMLYYILNDIPLDMDKKRFDVTHASLHEYEKKNKSIRKVL